MTALDNFSAFARLHVARDCIRSRERIGRKMRQSPVHARYLPKPWR